MVGAGAGWLLAVDFGTSNTAAAHVDEVTGSVVALPLSHSGNLMPSAAFAVSATRIDVGQVAVNKAVIDPSCFIAAPKRLLSLGMSEFDLGGSMVPSYVVVAEILRTVLLRGQAHHDKRPPSGLVLTHPEAWSPQQVAVLTDAAAEIGYAGELVTTVSEPIAAAHFYADRAPLGVEDRMAVFDFGGGTLDIAVLAAQLESRFTVLAADGDNAIGGRNIDAAIRAWVQQQLAIHHPDLADALGVASVRDLRELETAIREAKELLSDAAGAAIGVRAGSAEHTLQLTRREFDDLIDAEIGRAVTLTATTLRAAGITAPGQLRAIYLTGGSSRIPLVHHRLRALGNLATLDDPKTVVARGAIIAAQQPPNTSPHIDPTPFTAAAPVHARASSPGHTAPELPSLGDDATDDAALTRGSRRRFPVLSPSTPRPSVSTAAASPPSTTGTYRPRLDNRSLAKLMLLAATLLVLSSIMPLTDRFSGWRNLVGERTAALVAAGLSLPIIYLLHSGFGARQPSIRQFSVALSGLMFNVAFATGLAALSIRPYDGNRPRDGLWVLTAGIVVSAVCVVLGLRVSGSDLTRGERHRTDASMNAPRRTKSLLTRYATVIALTLGSIFALVGSFLPVAFNSYYKGLVYRDSPWSFSYESQHWLRFCGVPIVLGASIALTGVVMLLAGIGRKSGKDGSIAAVGASLLFGSATAVAMVAVDDKSMNEASSLVVIVFGAGFWMLIAAAAWALCAGALVLSGAPIFRR